MRNSSLAGWITVLAVSSSFAVGQEPPFTVEWIHDVDSGFEIARARRQTVLIDFYADWCEPSKEMDRSVWTDPHVSEAAKRAVLVRVDYDGAGRLARRYSVNAVPTMVFVDPWGVEIGRIVGSLSSAEMVKRLEVVPGSFAAVASYHERAETNPDDASALVRIDAFYRSQKLLVGADVYYERAIDASDKGKRDPASAAEAYLGLGLNRMDRHECKKAVKHLEECVEKFRGSESRSHALFGLVIARARLGDARKARQELERLGREYPDYPSLVEAERIVAEASES